MLIARLIGIRYDFGSSDLSIITYETAMREFTLYLSNALLLCIVTLSSAAYACHWSDGTSQANIGYAIVQDESPSLDSEHMYNITTTWAGPWMQDSVIHGTIPVTCGDTVTVVQKNIINTHSYHHGSVVVDEKHNPHDGYYIEEDCHSHPFTDSLWCDYQWKKK